MYNFEVSARLKFWTEGWSSDSLEVFITYKLNEKKKVTFRTMLMEREKMHTTYVVKEYGEGKITATAKMRSDQISRHKFLNYVFNVLEKDSNIIKFVEKKVLRNYWNSVKNRNDDWTESEILKAIKNKKYTFSFVEE